jgi:hypothetical protein
MQAVFTKSQPACQVTTQKFFPLGRGERFFARWSEKFFASTG